MNPELASAAKRLIELRERIPGEWRADPQDDPRLASWGLRLRGPRSRDHDNSLDAIEPDDAEFAVAAFSDSARVSRALIAVAAAVEAGDLEAARAAIR